MYPSLGSPGRRAWIAARTHTHTHTGGVRAYVHRCLLRGAAVAGCRPSHHAALHRRLLLPGTGGAMPCVPSRPAGRYNTRQRRKAEARALGRDGMICPGCKGVMQALTSCPWRRPTCCTYLGTDLVAALARLEVDNFSHCEG